MVCVLKDITQRTSIMSDIVTHCGCWTLIRFGTWYIYNTVAFLEEIRFICSTYTWWSRDEIKQRNICGWDYQDVEYVVPLFPMAQWVNSPSAVQETWETRIWSLGQKDPLEEEMATDFFILAWKILWTEEPGSLRSKGWQSQTWLNDGTGMHHEWMVTLMILTGKNFRLLDPMHSFKMM